MNKFTHNLSFACLLGLCPIPAQAQVSIHIELGLPIAPRLVVVQPGIQVVEGFHEEVFFHKGWYWCRRPNGWYRSRSPQARFEVIESHRVPRGLTQAPAGHYRNWHHIEARPTDRRDAGDQHLKSKHEQKAERRDHRKEKHDQSKRDKHKGKD